MSRRARHALTTVELIRAMAGVDRAAGAWLRQR